MNEALAVIIPVHNRASETKACLECLQKQTVDGVRIVVVDDGSTDGTQEMLEQEFPDVVRLEGDGNLWWTGAINMGVRDALGQNADLIITLNNDVLIKEDYIQRLMDAHEEYPEAIIGSINLTQEEPPRLLDAGIVSHNPWTAKYVKRGERLQRYDGEFEGLLSTYSLPGRGVLIPRAVFETVGLYDEQGFPHYAADLDFSLRAAEAGFSLFVHAENPVYSPYEPDRAGGRGQSFFAFAKSFFAFRSSNYLPVLVRFNYRHCPAKPFFLVFFGMDLLRTIISFVRNKLIMRSRYKNPARENRE